MKPGASTRRGASLQPAQMRTGWKLPSRQLLLPTTLDFLWLQAQRRGDAGGVIFRGRRFSYGEIAAATAALAAWLAKRGIGQGDRVAIMATNNPTMVTSTFAVWALGGVTVPIAARSTAGEVAHLITHSRARALIGGGVGADVVRESATATGVPAYLGESDLPLELKTIRRGSRSARRVPAAPRPEALATIAYTSGTTGAPKGVMVSHANLFWSALACAQARGDRPEGVGASISPLTHTPVYVSHLLCRVLLGAAAVLLEKFDLGVLLESVERFRITDLPLIGGMVFDVVAMGSIPERLRASVQKVSVGGAPTPMEAKRSLAALFPGAEIIEAYGQSESTNGVAMARGTSVFEQPGTVGCTNPHVVVAVRRADGHLAAVDEEGELVIAGPTVMRGYYRNRPATAAALRDGWLHTGDLGRRNLAGYFFITGRVKDVIITGGENVSPAEVEDVLRLHPDVADVAVIGTPHPKWGEQVTAVVVPRAGACLEAATLQEFAGARLAGFKKPRRVELVPTLPRNAANKVQTNVLKQQFAAAEGGRREAGGERGD